MIYCLLGYTASGKDTILKELLEKTNIKKAVSYTTRPMRAGEEDGVSYHFVDDIFFQKNKDDFIEIRKYNVWDGSTWFYGYHKTSFPDINNKDYYAIITPEGYKSLCDTYGAENITVFHIQCPVCILRQRLNERGDVKEEIDRRLKADREDFKDFNGDNVKINYNKIFNFDSIDEAVKQILNIIR